MNADVTQSQIDEYRKNGFLHLPKLLDPDEVRELRQGIEDAVRSLGKRKMAGKGIQWDEGDAYYDKVYKQRPNLWKINDVVRRYVFDDALANSLCRLADEDALRVWHDQALIKRPHANPTAWHLDNPYWSFHSRQAITIWIALSDVDTRNGCLHFLPGSHRRVSFDNATLGSNFGELFYVYPDLKSIEPVPVPMQAGDCSFHNGLTAHCAGPNVSTGNRVAMTCAYMPDGSTFNGQQNILPDDYVAQLKVGDRLDDDTLNPTIGAASVR